MRLVDRDRVIELLKEKDYIKTSTQEKNINEIFDLAEVKEHSEPCRTCKYGEVYNNEWCRCTHYRISGYRLPTKNGCEVENSYGIAPYKE